MEFVLTKVLSNKNLKSDGLEVKNITRLVSSFLEEKNKPIKQSKTQSILKRTSEFQNKNEYNYKKQPK